MLVTVVLCLVVVVQAVVEISIPEFYRLTVTSKRKKKKSSNNNKIKQEGTIIIADDDHDNDDGERRNITTAIINDGTGSSTTAVLEEQQQAQQQQLKIVVYLHPPDRGGQKEVGIKYSQRLVETSDPNHENATWVVDLGSINGGCCNCKYLMKNVRESIRIRKQRQQQQTNSSSSNISWPILVYDVKDQGSPEVRCMKQLA